MVSARVPGVRLLLAFALIAVACSPSPTPVPAPTAAVTIETARSAYSTFLRGWLETHAAVLSSDASAVNGDPSRTAQYAAAVRDAYDEYARGLATLHVPDETRPSVEVALSSARTLVGLAGQLADDPTDAALNAAFHSALGRVTQDTTNLEAALGISR